MGKKNNRTCIICGKRYFYCNACNSEDAWKPTWYFIFDGENCHDIYEVCVAYRDKKISLKEAYEKISKLDISNIENFAESTKLQIQKIMQYKEEIKEEVQEEIREESDTKQENEELPKITYTKNSKNKK